MELSSQYTGASCKLNQTGQYLVSYSDKLCVLKHAANFNVIQTFRLSAAISDVQLSPNGLSILCCSTTKEDAEIKLFSHDTPEPLAHINPGIEGFTNAAFLNNTSIAVWSDVGLRVTIWTIKDKTCKPLVNVPWPKKAWAIHQQRYFALLRRVEGQDVVSIYDGKSDWQQASSFDVHTTDAADLSYSPCGRYLAIWESILESAIHIYTPTGQHLCHFVPPSTTGLGIRCVTWSNNHLIVGDYSSQIYLICTLTWTNQTISLSPSPSSTPTPIHRAPANDWLSLTRGYSIIPFSLSTAVLSSILHRPRPSPAGSKTGITQLACSSRHLAIRAQEYPNNVFLFSGTRLKAVLEYDSPVSSMQWRPLQPGEDYEVLVVAWNKKGVGLWFDDGSPAGRAEGMGVPSKNDLVIRRTEWSSDGSKLLLKGKTTFLLAYPIAD